MSEADDPNVVGKCCHWTRLTLEKAKGSPFGLEDGLVEVSLGSVEPESHLVKSVLYCPFCGTKMPYKKERLN